TRLFQAFTQIRSTLSSGRTGTGLGLSISGRLAELMGGRIAVVSTLGVGSIFTLELPLRPVTEPQPQSGPRPKAHTERRRSKVLVGDEGEDNRIIISEFVKREGHDVLMAEDGIGAVEMARDPAPDLIFMDVAMPGIDGVEAAAMIRRMPGEKG